MSFISMVAYYDIGHISSPSLSCAPFSLQESPRETVMERRTLGVLLAGAAAFVNLYAPHSLLPLLRGWMGASAALSGLTISAGTLGVALAAPFAGRIADRLGRRR